MKRESMRLIPGVILAVLLLPISPALAGEASGESDIELAKEIAQVEVA
jgi:ABC-type methionine transport system permease subunit